MLSRSIISRVIKSIAFMLYTTGLILIHPALILPNNMLSILAVSLILLSMGILILTHPPKEAFRSLLILQGSILLISLILVTLTLILPHPSPQLTSPLIIPEDSDMHTLPTTISPIPEPERIMDFTQHPTRIAQYALKRTRTTTPHTLLELGIQSILLFLISLAYSAHLSKLPE